MTGIKSVCEIKCSKRSLDDLEKKQGQAWKKTWEKKLGLEVCLFVYVIS